MALGLSRTGRWDRFGPELLAEADPAALGLSRWGWWVALDLSRRALRSAVLGLCMGQLASAPGVHPHEVSGVGALPMFQVWSASRGFRCGPPLH